MYNVYCDSNLLYSSTIENLKIINPKATLEDNKTGSFTFKIYPDHPFFNTIQKLTSIILVYQDDFLLFRGRVLNEEIGFHNEKSITCEGDLAFLLDSIQRPYDYSGSIEGFLTQLITAHNEQVDSEKQFAVGNVTVTDTNNTIARSDINYTKTWEVIEKKLIGILGGHIIIRHENGINYVDYLADYTTISDQKIEFAKNLLDMKRKRKGQDIITALIPLGAKLKNEEGTETDERLTIKSENGGLDYIYDEDAVAEFGWIFGTNTWDDVTVASNLLTKGRAYLASLSSVIDTLELSAADLAGIEQDINSFHLGTYVRVTSNPHGIDQNFLVSKIQIDLMKPQSNKLTLGGKTESFTGQANGIFNTQVDINNAFENLVTSTSQAIYQTETNLQASIQASESNIISNVSEKFYLKDETDSLISEVSTTVEQNKNEVSILFEQYSAEIEDLAAGTDAEFEEIKKYIRFIDGKILLGEVGNELELQIANDRISFLQNNAEVAYFSNNKLYVTDGEYTNSLRLGQFAFLPRENGNLSFKKLT